MQGRGGVIEEKIERLAMDGFLVGHGNNEFRLTDKGRNESYKINKARAKDEYKPPDGPLHGHCRVFELLRRNLRLPDVPFQHDG